MGSGIVYRVLEILFSGVSAESLFAIEQLRFKATVAEFSNGFGLVSFKSLQPREKNIFLSATFQWLHLHGANIPGLSSVRMAGRSVLWDRNFPPGQPRCRSDLL